MYTLAIFLEGRLLQVDTFTAKRYSQHWINWVRPRHTHKETCKRHGTQDHPPKSFFLFLFLLSAPTPYQSKSVWDSCRGLALGCARQTTAINDATGFDGWLGGVVNRPHN
jgi:hypothetical protein